MYCLVAGCWEIKLSKMLKTLKCVAANCDWKICDSILARFDEIGDEESAAFVNDSIDT